jgi:hypothetical protein
MWFATAEICINAHIVLLDCFGSEASLRFCINNNIV